jgi:RimJ/RimL family protein N-acetyltransferase
MTAPHETPPVGKAAAMAQTIAAMVPVIETARLRLRPMRLTDFLAWAGILCSDRSVYMDGPYTRDDAYTEFAASVGSWMLHGHGFWTVTDKEDAVLGFVGVNMEPSDHEHELGYFLCAAAEGHGYATEAAAAVRDWAFALGLPSLVSYVDPANDRSGAVARSLGAARDGVAESLYDGTPDQGMAVWRHQPGVRT